MPDDYGQGNDPQTTAQTATDGAGTAAPAATAAAPAAGQPAAGAGQPATDAGQSLGDGVPSLMDEGKPPQDGGAPQGAPENYDAFKAPDGREFKPEDVSGFVDAAKKAGFSQEQAQDMFGAMFPIADSYLRETLTKQVQAWTEQAKNDSEYGGANLNANLGMAKSAYDKFASPGLKQVLRASGLDNHPEMIRLFVRVGRTLSQDTGVQGSAARPEKVIRYPKSNMVEDY